jgi:hypothetical protein
MFQDRLNAVAAETETLLDQILGSAPIEGERSRPGRLLESIRYSTLGGGKRFRPFLVVESAALFGVPRHHALMTGAALECVHCYSLVHDDLPAMDNDDLRRGRPTAHKAFDDATAILAGDSLLTYAFDLLSRPQAHPSAEVRIRLVMALARASGLGGMVGGQILDLAAEGRFPDIPKPHTLNDVETLQAMKTGALIRFGCVAGAILGEADDARFKLRRGDRPGVPDRRRPARCRRRCRHRRQADRQGRGRRQGHHRGRARHRQVEAAAQEHGGGSLLGAVGVRRVGRRAQDGGQVRRRTADLSSSAQAIRSRVAGFPETPAEQSGGRRRR